MRHLKIFFEPRDDKLKFWKYSAKKTGLWYDTSLSANPSTDETKTKCSRAFQLHDLPTFYMKRQHCHFHAQLLIFLLNKVQTILKNTQTLNIAKIIAHAKTEHFWFIWNYL